MTIQIASPDTSIIPEIVSSILEITGRDVVFHYLISSEICPVCGGENPFCTTCFGNPFVETYGTHTVNAAVKWKIAQLPERKRYRPEGQYIDGDCQLTIAYDSDLIPILNATRKVVVDLKDCTIKSYYFRGEPEVNRIYVLLNEDIQSDNTYRI